MILITRPADKAPFLLNKLQVLGIAAAVCPVLEIQTVPLWQLRIPTLNPQAVILTSPYAAETFMKLNLKPEMLFVVGFQTLASLSFQGPLYLSPTGHYDLLPFLTKHLNPQGKEIIYLSGHHITYDFSKTIKGLPFHRIICYKAQSVSMLVPNICSYLKQDKIRGVTFFSKRTIHTFCTLALPFVTDFSNIIAYCLSEAIGEAARSFGFQNILISECPTTSSIIKLIEDTCLHEKAPLC